MKEEEKEEEGAVRCRCGWFDSPRDLRNDAPQSSKNVPR